MFPWGVEGSSEASVWIHHYNDITTHTQLAVVNMMILNYSCPSVPLPFLLLSKCMQWLTASFQRLYFASRSECGGSEGNVWVCEWVDVYFGCEFERAAPVDMILWKVLFHEYITWQEPCLAIVSTRSVVYFKCLNLKPFNEQTPMIFKWGEHKCFDVVVNSSQNHTHPYIFWSEDSRAIDALVLLRRRTSQEHLVGSTIIHQIYHQTSDI